VAEEYTRTLTDEKLKKEEICHCTARNKQADGLRGAPIKTWDCFVVEIDSSAVDKHLELHDPDHIDSHNFNRGPCRKEGCVVDSCPGGSRGGEVDLNLEGKECCTITDCEEGCPEE
jgi:hypothetical protein